MFVSKLVQELRVTLDNARITIQCDNKQTIGLVNKDIALLQTKLQHVDIHNYQLRQEAARKRIQVVYTRTENMIADSLTKSLSYEAYQRFVQQVRLVDITDKLKDCEMQEITQEEIDLLEELILESKAEVQTKD